MIHVLLNDELLAEWQVRYAGANRAIAAGQVAYVSFAHLNTRRVLAGDSDCVGVDVDSPGMPADCGSLDEDRARSAAGVKESPAGFPGESDHGGGYGRPQGTTAFDIAAVVLAHLRVGDAQTGDNLAGLVLDHPYLDIGRIGKAPV